MHTYDIMSGGLNKLSQDLDAYVKYLTYANMEIVSDLSKVAYNDIIGNAGRAYEDEQVLDIYSRTKIEVHKRGKNISSDRVVNNSPKASFAEFGYGVLGKNAPYSHGDFLDRYAIGWYGYDINTPYKRPNRSWFYKDMYGNKVNTFGAVPRNIFYNASQSVISQFPSIAYSRLNRW